MNYMTKHHKVFLSYHHENDEYYKNQFAREFGHAYVSKTVEVGDMNPNLKTETIRRKIRDEYLRDSTVTVVLVGKETWKRKHIDWEISASIRHTEFNARSGLLGLILPTHPNYSTSNYNPHIIPPRLYDNIKCEFAKIYNWIDNPSIMQEWIHDAFLRKNNVNPDNSRKLFRNNRSGSEWQ